VLETAYDCGLNGEPYPDIYSQCNIEGRGNFALQNWVTHILPRYGHFVKSIDVALCWTHSDQLPDREKELIKVGAPTFQTNQPEFC
jgi:hypothetical protein